MLKKKKVNASELLGGSKIFFAYGRNEVIRCIGVGHALYAGLKLYVTGWVPISCTESKMNIGLPNFGKNLEIWKIYLPLPGC